MLLARNCCFGVILFLILYGCAPASSADPNVTGDLFGRVIIVDSLGDQVSGGIAAIKNSALSSKLEQQGWWHIAKIPLGVYTVVVSKPGYGSVQWGNIQIPGPGAIYLQSLQVSVTPSCRVKLDSIVEQDGRLLIYGIVDEYGTARPSAAFLVVDTSSTINPGEPHFLGSKVVSQVGAKNQVTFSVSNKTFGDLRQGSKVYFSAYTQARFSDEYWLADANQWLPTTPSPKSNVLSYTIP